MVFFTTTHWTRCWSPLQKEAAMPRMRWACWMLETTVIEIFARHGWTFFNRLTA
uniref:Uncharacterized protein n=1 Tax=Arundo donax TaxID=35708 RepID=A0A0A8Y7C5_ARUDO